MADKTRLAIVGASARAAAQSAARAGFDVVTADLFADEDLRRLCPATRIPQENYPDGLADWLAEQEVDAWKYTGALENYPELVDRMADLRPLWGNRGDALRRVRDPFELQRALADAGLLFPETRNEPTGLPRDGSWLIKPIKGSGGLGVRPLVDAPPSLPSDHVYQQRIEGVAASLLFSCRPGKTELLGGATQIIGGNEFGAEGLVFCGCVRNEAFPLEHRESVARLLEVLTNGFGLRDLVGVDLMIGPAGATVLEVNPRFTASAELLLGAAPLPSGKAVLYARRPVVVPATLTEWALAEADRRRLADIPAAETRLDKGQPVLTILEDGPTKGVLERLKARAAEVESHLYA